MLGRRSKHVVETVRELPAAGDGLLPAGAYERLAARIDQAARKARGSDGATLVSVTWSAPTTLDPIVAIGAALILGESDACWMEHPERAGAAVAGVGAVAVAQAEGARRFAAVAESMADRCAGMLADDPFDDPAAPGGSGVTWLGGFAFGDDRPRSNHWSGFGAMRFVLPALGLARRLGDEPQSRMTLNLLVHVGDVVGEHLERCEALVDAFVRATRDDNPTRPAVGATVASPAAPEHYEGAVAQAVRRIRAGEFEKIVLAREIDVHVARPFEIAKLATGLRARFPGCLSFVVCHDGRTYLGATPELLLRREGRQVSTMGLAGSARRGLDPAADEHIGRQLLTSRKDREEHAIVVRRIERTLGRVCAWVAAAREPELVKVKNIQHLATPIRAQLLEPRPLLELAGALHPTPAVGGEPWPRAQAAIAELEGFDRGWYTGGVGWTDSLEDGEIYVGLRCALLEGNAARMFAGAGIVAESDPAAELAETEVKFGALLPLLSGDGA